MRKTLTSFSKNLKNGLVNQDVLGINSEGLVEAMNVVPGEDSLDYVTHLSRIIATAVFTAKGITIDWNNTRMLQMDIYIVVAHGSKIYYCESPYSVLVEYSIKQFYHIEDNYTMSGVGTWVLQRFGSRWIASNGTDTIIGYPDYSARGVVIGCTATGFGLYAVFGGFKDGYSFLLENRIMASVLGDRMFYDLVSDRLVWWGSVMSPLTIPFVTKGELDTISPSWDVQRGYETGDCGFEVLDSKVLAVCGISEIGGMVVALCEKSVYVGKLISVDNAGGMIPTIVWEKVWNTGVYSRTAFGVGGGNVVFVDIYGRVVVVGKDGGKVLGFKLWALTGTINITFDNVTGYWYISNGTTSRVLNSKNWKMGGCSRHYMGIGVDSGVSKGLFVDGGGTESMEAYATIAPFDLGRPGVKRIVSCTFGGLVNAVDSCTVTPSGTQNNGEVWASGSEITLNTMGFGVINYSAEKFKLKIKTSVAQSRFDSLDIEWEGLDRRYIRGWGG